MKLQLARQNAIDHPSESSYKEEETDLKQRYDVCSYDYGKVFKVYLRIQNL